MALHLTSIERATGPRLQPWEMLRLARLIEGGCVASRGMGDVRGYLPYTPDQRDLDGIVEALRIAAELA